MAEPTIAMGCVSNLYSRMMHFKQAGDMEMGHTHPFDHLTLLAKGRLKVGVNRQVTEYVAPQMIFIKAEYRHELTALEDDTLAFCIHALRGDNESGDILDPAFIPKGIDPLSIAAPVAD